MKTISKIAAGLLTVSTVLAAANAFAECTQKQEAAAGKQIADAVANDLRANVPHQSKRLIKVTGCDVIQGVVTATFTYNYLSDGNAYAVDGSAQIKDGSVQLAQLDRPQVVFASIASNYVE